MRLNYFKVEVSNGQDWDAKEVPNFFSTIRKLRDLNARHFDKTNPAVEDVRFSTKEKPVKKIR
jgi:hypothetical protein